MRLFVARLADAEARDAISESVPSVVPDTSLKKAASLLKGTQRKPDWKFADQPRSHLARRILVHRRFALKDPIQAERQTDGR